MAECDECGEYENLPYQCHRCGRTFCAEHRLPENHDCPGLNDEWNDPEGVFDSGFDDSVDGGESEGLLGGVKSRIRRETSTGGVLGYFRGNVTYTVLGLMWVTFAVQLLLQVGLGLYGLHETLFVLSTTHPEYVWTWFTSILAHGGFQHILFNSIALYFFGPVVERRLGSKRYAILFVVAGAIAGLAQVGVTIVTQPGIRSGVVGASGAIMAVMGLLTVLRPNLKVYLYFILPMPLWVLTFGFAAFSVVAGFSSVGGAGNVAHLAHLAGMAIGLAYGARVKGERRAPESIQLGGGGGGGPGGPGGPGRGRF